MGRRKQLERDQKAAEKSWKRFSIFTPGAKMKRTGKNCHQNTDLLYGPHVLKVRDADLVCTDEEQVDSVSIDA